MEHVRCDLCGSDTPSLLLERVDRFSDKSFRYMICPECGLIYLNPRPGEDELLAYYPEDYESYKTAESLRGIARWRRQHALGILRRFVEHYQRPGKLLDIGCATGEFLAEMRSHDWKVRGIEVNAHIAKIAQARHGLDVFIGTLDKFDTPDQYNVVTMWDVLEHLPSPCSALQKIHRMLSCDGRVIFCIPNMKSFDARLFGQWWTGWDAPRHLYMFPWQVLDVLLARADFEVEARHCILGGPGAFMLSFQFWLDNTKLKGVIKSSVKRACELLAPYLLWPYKEISYALNRGPVITIVARKVT